MFGECLYCGGEFFVKLSNVCRRFGVGGGYLDLIGVEGQAVDEWDFGFAFFEAKVGLEVGKHYGPGWAVERVYGEWQSNAFEMYADLMSSSGYRLYYKQGDHAEVGKELPVCDSRFASLSVDSHELGGFAAVGQGCVDSAGFVVDETCYEGEVGLLYQLLFK